MERFIPINCAFYKSNARHCKVLIHLERHLQKNQKLLPVEWFFYVQNSITMTLKTTNPHCFTYKTDELLIELLGSVRIDTLDRMG